MLDDRNAEIHRRNLAGETQKALAEEFGVTSTRIRDICREVQWRHENTERANALSPREVRAIIFLETRGHKVE